MVGMTKPSEIRRPFSVMIPRFGGQSIRTQSYSSMRDRIARRRMSVGTLE